MLLLNSVISLIATMDIIKLKISVLELGAKFIFEGSWCLVWNSLRTQNFTEDFQDLTCCSVLPELG